MKQEVTGNQGPWLTHSGLRPWGRESQVREVHDLLCDLTYPPPTPPHPTPPPRAPGTERSWGGWLLGSLED